MAADVVALRNAVDTLRADLEQRVHRLERLTTTPHPVPPASGRLRVSVIMATRNRARLLAQAIASVTAQTFPDWELLIMDDHSDDDTRDVIRNAAMADERVKAVAAVDQRRTVGAMRNSMIALAEGDLIAYLDDDNTWYPSFLAAAVSVFDARSDVDFAYGALVHSSAPPPVSPIMWEPFDRAQLLKANYIDTNVIVHRRSLVERVGGWHESLDAFGDWELALRCTEGAPALPIPVLAARYNVYDIPRMSTASGKEAEYHRLRQLWPLR